MNTGNTAAHAELDASPLKYAVSAADVMTELKKHMLVDGFDTVLDLERSSDGHFVDAVDGRRFLDFFTCFASMPLGFNHPKITDESFQRYLGMVASNKPSNSDVYTRELASFVKTFFELAVPEQFKYAFFIEGGALAVENALKVAFDWKVRKNFRKGYQSERGHQVLHFHQAFHGRTGYTMSLTNTDPTKTALYPKFNWPRVHNPSLRFPLTDEVLQDVLRQEERSISEIKEAFRQNKDEIACIILEPIQGEGGDNHFRPEYLRKLRELADENEAMLIFDEVQTGVGLTGTMWAHEQLGVTPDIMTFGKKMQVCGIIATERVDEESDNVFHTPSRINSTWGGNLVDMVRAAKYLEIIHEEKLLENVNSKGVYLLERLEELSREFPLLVSNVRGRGLFTAFDLPNGEQRAEFRKKCFEKGLIILASGEKSIRFRPPLNITEDHIIEGVDIIRSVLEGTAAADDTAST